MELADVQPGQRVLIRAAAGGVGHLAVQVAKLRGAHIIGTARAAKHDFLRGLGADELVDYTTTDFTQAVQDVDVVLDVVGGAYGPRSLEALRAGGLLITATLDPGVTEDEATARDRRLAALWVRPSAPMPRRSPSASSPGASASPSSAPSRSRMRPSPRL